MTAADFVAYTWRCMLRPVCDHDSLLRGFVRLTGLDGGATV